MQNELDPFRELEFPPAVPTKKQLAAIRRIARGTYKGLSFISPVAGTLALILVGIVIYFGYPVYKNYNYTNPALDGYVAPRSPGDIVSIAQASTVTVECILDEDNIYFGSGWAIDLKPSSKQYKTSIITNHHVIEDCLNNKGKIEVVDEDDKRFSAKVDIYDVENDLAKISSTIDLEPLNLSENVPYPGYWVMTYGTSDDFKGSVSFGAVMNLTETEVLITANISHGNSGGPLLDNEGNVIGTTSWGHKLEQYNGAMSLDAMCAKILKCKHNKGKYYWR
jgi:S1-C subfamily serine protease